MNRTDGPPSLRLVALPSSVAAARGFVVREVSAWGLEPPPDLELLTSEAVSNAVEHAVTDFVDVEVFRSGQAVRVVVHDNDSTPPHIAEPVIGQIGGYGMFLVDKLAREWGVEQVHDDGKRVWFEIPLDDSSGAAGEGADDQR